MPYYFGTLPLTSGVRTFANIGAGGINGCLIGNESGLTIIVTMQGSNLRKSLYPGTVDWFPVGPAFNGVVQIDPDTMLANSSSWPGQFVQIDVYGSNEQPGGVYPLSLTRANNIGNTLVTSGSVTANTLSNDGSVPGTQFIEAIPTGDTTSAVSLTNTGILTLGNSTHHGSLSSDNATFKTDGSGNLTFGGKLTVSTNIILDAITAATQLVLNSPSSDLIFKSGGTEIGRITGNGAPGVLTLTNGTPTTFNGPTAGSVNFYLMLNGTIKIMIANFNGYQNNTATRQTFTFPLGITINGPSFWIASDIPGCQGFLSGVGNTINIFTTLAAAGGSVTNQNNINKNSFGYHQGAATDSLKDTANDATGAHTGQLIAIGF